jgi:hypothetical protein
LLRRFTGFQPFPLIFPFFFNLFTSPSHLKGLNCPWSTGTNRFPSWVPSGSTARVPARPSSGLCHDSLWGPSRVKHNPRCFFSLLSISQFLDSRAQAYFVYFIFFVSIQ